jgi:sarcosine oxidase
MNSYDVIVIGVGGMGAAAAAELARRGRRVLGLEQFTLVHERGSSHGHTRIIRKAYFEHPAYVPLLQRAYERWYDLEQASGQHLFTECGCLSIGAPGGELIGGICKSAAEHRLNVEPLEPAELRRRFPAFRFSDAYGGVLEREAGFLYVERCVQAFVDQARLLGAELHEEEPVRFWRADGNAVLVETVRQTYTARSLVITAGAWAAQLLGSLRLPLTVTRKVLLWFATAEPALFRRDRFPVYIAETPEGNYYGFPALDCFGHKVARHDGGMIVADPLVVDRQVSDEDTRDCRQFLQAHLPLANGPLRHSKVCLYTLTPDRHFLIDVHPHHPNVAVAAGFSGHGFKFASVVGDILADLADKGRTNLPIEMFRILRSQGSGVRSQTKGS